MKCKEVVLRDDDRRRVELEADGWVIVARSWGAQLTKSMADVDVSALVRRGSRRGDVRELVESDLLAVLTLDALAMTLSPAGHEHRAETL